MREGVSEREREREREREGEGERESSTLSIYMCDSDAIMMQEREGERASELVGFVASH